MAGCACCGFHATHVLLAFAVEFGYLITDTAWYECADAGTFLQRRGCLDRDLYGVKGNTVT
jgi:hypothetical protein